VNRDKLGVDILFVGLGDIRPPAESPANIKGVSSEDGEEQNTGSDLSFGTMAEAVELRFANSVAAKVERSTAEEFKQAEILRRDAGVEQEKVMASVEVDLAEIRAKAEMERLQGESGPYLAAPEVYRQWRYLEAFQKAVVNARKFVIAVGKGIDVHVDLDLQESLRRDLYDIPGTNK
jgi:regulator of protease activity HflC (stomatin/prohibitin superfamily)